MKQILIKTDMTEMPQCCSECPRLRRYGDSRSCKEANYRGELDTIFWSRPEWCPLVEHIVDDDKKVRE